MKHYDFKVFTRVLWQFTTKFARVFWCKQGQYTRKLVDTPERWHTVCLIFGKVATLYLGRTQISNQSNVIL